VTVTCEWICENVKELHSHSTRPARGVGSFLAIDSHSRLPLVIAV
jgi:hypothetical protein